MSDEKRGLGLLGPSPPDYRDFLYGAPSAVLAELPTFVDLRDVYAPRIFDQLSIGSCVANAVNAMVQYVERHDQDPDYDRLSRLWTYYYAREKIGTVNEDSGCFIRDGVAVTAERGVPREKFWPYDINKFTVEPTAGEKSAPEHKTLEYRSVLDGNEQDMRACIAEGYPFVYGFAVYNTFWNIRSDGKWLGERGPIDGYHAVACWGYDFRPGAFGFPLGGWIIRNSWSNEWGHNGYFYVPRPYMSIEAFDCWTIRKVKR